MHDAVGTPGKRTLTEALPPIQRKPAATRAPADGTPSADAQPRTPAARSTGTGAPLDAGLRRQMESLFGADFSAVRIHEGDHATAAGAVAYTQGTDIHFGPGHYDPHSATGRKVLAHELAHVVQQAGSSIGATGEAGGLALNDDPSLEAHADAIGERVARGESVAGAGGAGSGMAAIPARSGGAIQRVKLIKDGHKGWIRDKFVAKTDESTKDDDEPQSQCERVDTSQLHHDPLRLFEIASSIQNTQLANEVWADYEPAMIAYCTPGTVVMRIGSKQEVVGRGTVFSASANVCNLDLPQSQSEQPEPDSQSKKRAPSAKVSNYRMLRPLYEYEVNTPDEVLRAAKVKLCPGAQMLVELLRAPRAIGLVLDYARPTEAQVALIAAVTKDHGGEPNTRARSVFVKEGSWDDAHACFVHHTGVAKVTGHERDGDRFAQTKLHDLTLILRETSASANTIAATFEIQIGNHICEYKWQRSSVEQKHEEGRVAHWDPDAPIEQVRTALAGAMIAKAATGPQNGARSGGSSGPVEQPEFKSLQEFLQSGLAKLFKPGALQHLVECPASEPAKLLCVNRGFVGSRIEVGSQSQLEDQDEYASIEPVRSYHQRQSNQQNLRQQALGQLGQLELETEARGKKHQGTGARGAISLVSIKQRFWAGFAELDEQTQIRRIDEALAPFGLGSDPRTRVEVASQLPYTDDQDLRTTEPRSQLQIGEYRFDIASRHAYKFHEQSLGSHPGHGGTLKEIELAIVQAALARHLAGALPRMGAIGGIAESPYAVTVGGVRIVYLAWAAAPSARLIHISDYMAMPVQPTAPVEDTGSSTEDSLDKMLHDARTLGPEAIGQWPDIVQRAVRKLGHVPRPLLGVMATLITKLPELAHDLAGMLLKTAPACVPDLVAELAAVISAADALSELGRVAIDIYHGPDALPDIVVATLAHHARRLVGGKAADLLGGLGLANHPAAVLILG